jgi:hypothetical protein
MSYSKCRILGREERVCYYMYDLRPQQERKTKSRDKDRDGWYKDDYGLLIW